jgi:hypothetical protein
MITSEIPFVQDLFLTSQGKPVRIGGKKIILTDRVKIPARTKVSISFIGERIFRNNGAVIAIRHPGKIFMSDGSKAQAVVTWDEPNLPRKITYVVSSANQHLEVYNRYRIKHSDDFVTEDSFTGNAGMHVTQVSHSVRRYECSNGLVPFKLDDLIFELSWESVPK